MLKVFEVLGRMTLEYSLLVSADDRAGAEDYFLENGMPQKGRDMVVVDREVLDVEEVVE